CLLATGQSPCSLKPVADQVGEGRDAALVAPEQVLDIRIPESLADPIAAEEWRVADDHIRLWPRRLHRPSLLVIGQDGVHALDVVQRLEDRAGRDAEAVVVEPLDITNPD